MKKMLNTLKILGLLFVFMSIISMKIVCASTMNKIPFRYNVIPTTKINTIIDTNAQKELTFELFFEGDTVYYQGKKLLIEDGQFKIDTASLTGQQTIQFQNENKETATFTYYFSQKDGKVDGYELVKNIKLDVYVTTIGNIQVIYTKQESKAVNRLKQYLKELPKEMIISIKTITLIPYSNTSNIAGTAKDNNIILYHFSQYVTKTQKNILFHEIAHIWANQLMQQKLLDYSYTKYQEAVKLDNNFVSQYSHQFMNENGKYSEDFADSVAFYFINTKSFAKKYPHRSEMIANLLQ